MLYQTIVDYFIESIEKGTVLPGEKLPSLRKVSDRFDVSLSTAVEAYRKLELFGYVEARDRSGYIARLPLVVENILKPSKSFRSNTCEIEHIDEIIQLINQTADKETAPFGVGLPSNSRFPNKMLNRYLIRTIKQYPESNASYIFGQGLLQLRTELCKYTKSYIGYTSPDNLIITNGCLEAINISLGAECETGDLVAIESPCYFGLLHAIHYHGLKAIEVKTDPLEGLDPEALENLAKTKKIKALISTPTAQNPLGFTMSDKRKKEILSVCKKYNIRIIEDDVYREISFGKKKPKSYKYFDKDNIVTYCASFSKFLGPGLRLGWVIPARNTQKYIRQKLSLNLANSSLIQYTAQNILRGENLQNIGEGLASYYQSNIQIYSNVLQSQLGDRITLTRPTGSYFLWARVEGLDSREAYGKAIKKKISFTPGPLFSANNQYLNYLRINCAHEFDEKRHQDLMSLSKLLTLGFK
jgi:DNA-binding transcriptional MocR family regulator